MANTLIISTFQLSVKPILQLMGQMLHVVPSSFYRRGVFCKNKQEMIVIKESLSIKKKDRFPKKPVKTTLVCKNSGYLSFIRKIRSEIVGHLLHGNLSFVTEFPFPTNGLPCRQHILSLVFLL